MGACANTHHKVYQFASSMNTQDMDKKISHAWKSDKILLMFHADILAR